MCSKNRFEYTASARLDIPPPVWIELDDIGSQQETQSRLRCNKCWTAPAEMGHERSILRVSGVPA
jgi:hypothetical protein